jgi:hypothetical protein
MRSTKAITKWMMGAALAGAFLFAAPDKAQAQVSFGVGFGSYAAPAYGYQDSYPYDVQDEWQRQGYIEHEQHERWEAERAAQWRHEQWEQQRFYDRDSHRDRDNYRDDRGWRHDHDHDRY